MDDFIQGYTNKGCIQIQQVICQSEEMRHTAQSLEDRREQYRVRIRREKHDVLLKRHREAIIANADNGPQPIGPQQTLRDLYRASIRPLGNQQHQRVLFQLQNRDWSSEEPSGVQLTTLAIIGNLLVDKLELDALQQVADIILNMPPNCSHTMYGGVQAFAISGLFRCYNRLEEQRQNQVEQTMLPVIFEQLMTMAVNPSTDLEIQTDLLGALSWMVACDQLELYGRLLRNKMLPLKLVEYHQIIQAQPRSAALDSLQIKVFDIYEMMLTSRMPIDRLFADIEERLGQVCLNCLPLPTSPQQETELTSAVLSLISELLNGDRADSFFLKTPELLKRMYRLWFPTHPKCMHRLMTNYPDLLGCNPDVLRYVVSDIMDGCRYSASANHKHMHLQTMFEYIKYFSHKYGKQSQPIKCLQSQGGVTMLQVMEREEQNEQCVAILKDIMDFLYDQSDSIMENE